jgi:hypothetical protein
MFISGFAMFLAITLGDIDDHQQAYELFGANALTGDSPENEM